MTMMMMMMIMMIMMMMIMIMMLMMMIMMMMMTIMSMIKKNIVMKDRMRVMLRETKKTKWRRADGHKRRRTRVENQITLNFRSKNPLYDWSFLPPQLNVCLCRYMYLTVCLRSTLFGPRKHGSLIPKSIRTDDACNLAAWFLYLKGNDLFHSSL